MDEPTTEKMSVLVESSTDEEFWYTTLHFGRVSVRVSGALVEDAEDRHRQAQDLEIAVTNFGRAFWQLVDETTDTGE